MQNNDIKEVTLHSLQLQINNIHEKINTLFEWNETHKETFLDHTTEIIKTKELTVEINEKIEELASDFHTHQHKTRKTDESYTSTPQW